MKSGYVSSQQWSVPLSLSLFLAWLFLLVATRNPACYESSSNTCLALASASTSASASASTSRAARFQSRAEKSGAFRARIAAADRSESERDNNGESRWICLRSTTPRGKVSLRTLREHRGSRRYALREEETTTTTTTTTTIQRSDFRPTRGETRDITSVDSEFVDWCWQSARNNNTTPTNDNGRPPPNSVLSRSTRTGAKRNEPKGNIKSVPRLRSRRLDLLFATERFRNQEISLPMSIAELFQQQQHQQQHQQQQQHETSSRPDPETLPEDDSRSQWQWQWQWQSPRSLVAGPGVDLTGRWRPVAASVDAVAYDAFLLACCSEEVSYWTRRLLVSSPIVSRQELVVEQSGRGRFLRLVDVHPLVTEAWNRTVATTADSNFESDTRSNGTYTNELIDPKGDPILVDAFWQAGGNVHTAITRKGELALELELDRNRNRNRIKSQASPLETGGWIHVHSYLEEEEEDGTREGVSASSLGPDAPSRVLIVETTYHSTAFPANDEEELALLTRWEDTRFARNSDSDSDETSDDLFGTSRDRDRTATKMVWRWEQVPEPAR